MYGIKPAKAFRLVTIMLFYGLNTLIAIGQINDVNIYHRSCDTVFNNFLHEVSESGNPDPMQSGYPIQSSNVMSFDVNGTTADEDKIRLVQKQLAEFRLLTQNDVKNVKIRPLDQTLDSLVYNHLAPFTRNMTFAAFDRDHAEKTLFYLLIMPGQLLKQSQPKIVSWKLTYFGGRFLFENLFGQLGTEAFFESVR